MPWAKLHTDILGDPKLMRAARKGAKGLEYLPWLIAFAKGADDHGRLTVGHEPADAVDIADLVPGATSRGIRTALNALEAIGVLLRDEDGALAFARWDVRSESKPSDSPSAIAERVARHRTKLREATRNAESETPGNASDVTPGNATEKKREEESKRRGEESADARATAGTNGHAPRAGRRPSAPPPAWAGPLADHWISRVGATTPAKVARALAAAVAQHGEPLVLRGMDAWINARVASSRAMKLDWFAEEASLWVERASAPEEPLVVAGWMSRELERETRP
jgi:hypothetical protein